MLIIILQACHKDNKSASAPVIDENSIELTEDQLRRLEISLVAPEKKALESYIHFNGKIVALPNYRAEVSSNVQGKIEKVFVHEGDYVEKGKPLIELSSMRLVELQEEYFAAKNETDFLTIELTRQEELRKNNVGALVDLQTVQTKHRASLNRQASLKAKLALLGIDMEGNGSDAIRTKLSIKAPISGYIHSLPVSVGMIASSETILAELIDVSQLLAEIYVYEKDIDLIKSGQPVTLDFINHSFGEVQGTVFNIDKVIDESTKAINVFVKFSAPDKSIILPDMNIMATLENKSNNTPAPTVPRSSILQEDDLYYIFLTDKKVKDGKIKLSKHKVDLGDKNEKLAEVIFPNPVENEIFVAVNNVMAIEMERKKKIGGVFAD
ncbi:efflux RND transporter periplasmic adaptor subunit [Sporocytophaga myxococcoides]|uniref:efflux RND transporter periplasmic adaptor subunit n=1 Tax=Sporocytophaga myxococcoides TaxID=153721 RepID=UPI0003F9FCEF|nr:efflux RND transporter periplasmic adaptor subunit [Sporocytophaga myxococcoides]